MDVIKDDCRYVSDDAAIYVDTGAIHCAGREYILGRLRVDETPNINVNNDLPETVKKRLRKILAEFEGNGGYAGELVVANKKSRLSMPEQMPLVKDQRGAFRALSWDQSFDEHSRFSDSRRISLREKVGSCIEMLKSKLLPKAVIPPFSDGKQKDVLTDGYSLSNTANHPILMKTIITLNRIEPPINCVEGSSNYQAFNGASNLNGSTNTERPNRKSDKNNSKCERSQRGSKALKHTKTRVSDASEQVSMEKGKENASIPNASSDAAVGEAGIFSNTARAGLNSQLALAFSDKESNGKERVTNDDRTMNDVLRNTMSKLRKIGKRYSKTPSNIDLKNGEALTDDVENQLQQAAYSIRPLEVAYQTCNQSGGQKFDLTNHRNAKVFRVSTQVRSEPDPKAVLAQSVERPGVSRNTTTLISSIKALANKINVDHELLTEVYQPTVTTKGDPKAPSSSSDESTVFFVGWSPARNDICLMRMQIGDLLVTGTMNNRLNIAIGDVIYEIDGSSVRQMKEPSIKKMLQMSTYHTIGYYCNRAKFTQTGQTRRLEPLFRSEKMNYPTSTEDESIQSIHSYKSNITPRSTIVQRRPGNAAPNIMTRVSHSIVSSGGVGGGMHLPFSGSAFSGLAGLASGMGIPLRSSAKGHAGGHAMVAINETREREKKELSHLNDKFAQYVEKVRFLEAQNRKLQLELEALQNKAGHGSSRIKEMYEVEMQEAKKLIDDTLKEKAISEAKAQNAENQSNNFKKRYQEMMMTRGSDRQQLDQIEQEIAENEAKIHLLRRRLADLEDECRRYKAETQRLLGEISRMTNELNNEVFAKSSLETEKMALEDELQMLKTMHEAELNELKSRTNLDVGLDPSQFFRNELANAIKEIRNEYELANEQQRSDLHQKYMIHYNELVLRYQKPEIDPIQYEQHRLQEEKMRASLSCARSEVNQMKNRNEDLAQRIRDVQLMLNQEKDDARHMSALRDQELDELRAKLELLLKEYEEVSSMKTSLEKEISEYRELLEGTSNHDGLRQVVEHIEEEARRLESERGLENISNAAASIGNRATSGSYFASRSVTSHSSGSPIAPSSKQYPSSTTTVQSSFNRNFSNAVSNSNIRDF